jgi:hypothetical protein
MALLTPGIGTWDLRKVREDFLSTVPNNVRQLHALGGGAGEVYAR